jgi:hypothetical protein
MRISLELGGMSTTTSICSCYGPLLAKVQTPSFPVLCVGEVNWRTCWVKMNPPMLRSSGAFDIQTVDQV